MGSVQIASTDPVRRALIGMAPFFWGSSFILGILYAFLTFGGIENIWITILTGYVLFEISNTMFSSRKDMEGTLELLIGIGILGIVGYLLGFRFPQISPDPELTEMILSLFRTGTVFLTVPLIIDIVLLCILKGLRMLHN